MLVNAKIWKIGLVLSLTLTAFILSGCRESGQNALIQQTFPEPDVPQSAWGWVGIEFSQPMDTASVEDAFVISPGVEGVFIWEGNALWFRPLEAFKQNVTYSAQVKGDLLTANEEIVPVDKIWTFNIRPPSLIYYVPLGDRGEIWRAAADGSNALQLSVTGGNVSDFAPSRTGDEIAFSVENEAGGRDLWLMDRDGGNQRMLINCRPDGCGEPDWSMDQSRIAYTREVYDPTSGGYQPAQVWTVEIETGETAQLYQSEFAFGHSPTFSPDGKNLASYDTSHDLIRILNLTTSQESVVPRVLPGSGDWSPDGSRLIYTDVLPAENEPFVMVYLVELDSEIIQPAFEQNITDTDFSQPRWSPAGDWVAVSLRPVNTGISKSLWIMRLNSSETMLVVEEPSATFSAYRWDPWGKRLTYQRLALGSSDPDTSIWIWTQETGENKRVIENGVRPQWLP